MGIHNIHLLFPEGFLWPHSDLEGLNVSEPNENGIFTISGSDSEIMITDSSTFQLNSPLVSDNGDGTFKVSSK